MNTQTAPLSCQRALFDVPEDVVYLNAASKSVLLKASVDAGRIGVGAKGQPWLIDEDARYEQADDIRTRFASLIGANGDDIAIHPAASYGIATAARNISPGAGTRILLLDGQFPSNVYAWMHLAKESGAEIVTVPWPADGDWTEAVLSHIDARVSVAALPPCHWTDGSTLDLQRIGAALKAVGACFVVDATQWVGAVPIDVKALNVDYLVCAAYKWLLGPYGMSFMYAAPRHQQGMPIEDHLFNHGGLSSITGGLGYPDSFTAGARRFDAGEYLNLITLPMIQVALKQLQEWGPAQVSAYLAPIINAVADGAESLGYAVAGAAHRSPHILGIRRSGGFPKDINVRLAATGVDVSARGGAVRVSPYLFNTISDATQFLEQLEICLKRP